MGASNKKAWVKPEILELSAKMTEARGGTPGPNKGSIFPGGGATGGNFPGGGATNGIFPGIGNACQDDS